MSKSYKDDELQVRYGKSRDGNFYIRETIGVPHPFCITPRHIEAAQSYSGMLGASAIEDCEKAMGSRGIPRPSCGMKGCNLLFHEHEQGLLVACQEEMKDDSGAVNKELHQYLLDCKSKAEEDGFAGFAFIKV